MRFSVAIVMQRTPLAHRWASERWEPAALIPVVAGDAVATSPACIRDDASCTQWRFDGFALELHRSEAEGYHLNLVAPEPKVFVNWRMHEEARVPPVYPVLVTVSYNEAARMMDGGERVDALPLPDAVRDWMAPFVALHYKPEPKRKVRRNDPFAEGAFRRERGSRG
jgi:hypothetical protein